MPANSDGSDESGERLRRLELLCSALFRDNERLRSELKVVLAAQTRFGEDIRQISLDVEELKEKLNGQIGFTDLFRDEVGQRLKEIERKLSDLSNG
jgi:hypothetical protein